MSTFRSPYEKERKKKKSMKIIWFAPVQIDQGAEEKISCSNEERKIIKQIVACNCLFY